jgi:hypothetical protein
MRLVVAGVVLELLDALTTYLLLTWRLGYEANPRISFINTMPEWVFPLFLAQASFVGGVAYLAHTAKRSGFMRAYYTTAMPLIGYLVHKAIVVVNNVAVGAVGFGGLDYHLSEAVKLFMVIGGIIYGITSNIFKHKTFLTHA